MKTKVLIVVTPGFGWVAFLQSGNIAGSSSDLTDLEATCAEMDWEPASTVSGWPDWSSK